MPTPTPHADRQFATVLPSELRKAAAECSDPVQQASLLAQAEKMELAERRLNALASSGRDVLEEFRADVERRRRRNELPGWVVAVTLLGFAASLILIALKHYV